MRSLGVILSVSLLVLSVGVVGAKSRADYVLSLIERNYSGVRDYRVDVQVSVESPQVHMPRAKATVYYKRPDKVKVIAREGFMVLPTDVFLGSPTANIKRDFDIRYAGESKLGGEPVYLLWLSPKMVYGRPAPGQPTAPPPPQRLTPATGAIELVVEKRRGLILSGRADNAGMKMRTKWEYVRVDGKYWMPSRITVAMEGVMSPQAYDPGDMKVKPLKTGKGTAEARFSGYRINQGLSDSLFVEKRPGKP